MNRFGVIQSIALQVVCISKDINQWKLWLVS